MRRGIKPISVALSLVATALLVVRRTLLASSLHALALATFVLLLLLLASPSFEPIHAMQSSLFSRAAFLPLVAPKQQPVAACSLHMQPARAVQQGTARGTIRGPTFMQPCAAVPRPQQDRVDIHMSRSLSDAAGGSSLSTAQQRPTAWKRFGITGDGSCMFRACVQGHHQLQTGKVLPASQECSAALELRQAVVEELRKNREDMEPFLPGIADDFDDYLAKMSQPGVWGGEPELLMASKVLARPICVYQPAWTGPQHIITYGEDLAKSAAPLHLLWSGAHYDLLLPHPASKL